MTRADASTQRDLGSRTLDLPPGVAIRWTGAAGFVIECDDDVLVIDPYFTRVSLPHLLSRRPMLADARNIDRLIKPGQRVVGVAVGHTHFDHALDAESIVRRHRCPAYGSTSLQSLLGLHGLADHANVVVPHERYEVGPFTLRFVPSVHAPLIAGRAVPNAGELTCEHLDELSGNAYRCGDVWAISIEVKGCRIYHQGSADFIEDEVPSEPVDVFLAGIAGRNSVPTYFPRVLRALDPAQIVPTHYDNFFRSTAKGLPFMPLVNLPRWAEETDSVAHDARIVTLDLEPTAPVEPARPHDQGEPT